MPGEQKRILLVDDDETLSKALSEVLTRAGFAVSVERDGEAGLRAAKANPPDLMILDLSLPKLDGVELLKSARAEQSLAEVPTLILTNRDDVESLSAVLEAGHVDFLMKHEQRLEHIVALVRRRLGIEP